MQDTCIGLAIDKDPVGNPYLFEEVAGGSNDTIGA